MISEFFFQIAELKKLPRSGWKIKVGLENSESVAEHSYMMSVMSMVLSDLKNLNSDKVIKNQILSQSVFAVTKSGTVSLEVCNQEIPSIVIYKLTFLNFFLIKFLVKVKFVNIINIINDKEVIPELLQSECNAKEIFTSVNYFLKKPEMISKQLNQIKKTINEIKSETSSADKAAKILSESFVS